MYLKRLEIHGFKSFAQKTVLEFEKGMTAIVGPNGSGKSNLSDACRWVLGEQSSKMMRGKKSDDVIFAGSDKKTRLGFAEVFATFDNSDRKIPLDAAEVAIGRRIDRNGNSEYLINGQNVRLQDIVELVLKSGIGTSRYTVIGQGTIDQMILSGPTEIKNMLDEASGVKQYYMKREKTLRKLEVTAENLMRAEDLIKEIEPRLKTLRRQAKRMEERVVYEQDLKKFQLEYYSGLIEIHKSESEKIITALSSGVTKQNQAEAEIANLQAETERLEKESEVDESGKIRTQVFSLQAEKNRLTENLSMIRGKMQSQKTGSQDAGSIRIDLHEVQTKLTELEAKKADLSAKLAEKRKGLEERGATLAEINRSLSQLTEQMQTPAEVDSRILEKEITHLEDSFTKFWGELETSEDVYTIKRSATHFKDNFDQFLESSRRSLGTQSKSFEDLTSSLSALMSSKDGCTSQYNTLKNELENIELETRYLDGNISDLKTRDYNLRLELDRATATSEEEVKEVWLKLTSEENRLLGEIQNLTSQIESLEQDLQNINEHQKAKRAKVLEQDRKLREKLSELSTIKEEIAKINIEKAKVDTRFEGLSVEIETALGSGMVDSLLKEAVPQVTENITSHIARLKHQLDLIGGVDEMVVTEYTETEERYTHLTTQVDDLKKSMDDLRKIMDELDEHIKVKFNTAFHKINAQFEYYFRMLFNGGRAFLTLVENKEEKSVEDGSAEEAEKEIEDKLRPEEKIVQKYEKKAGPIGVDIKATPPGKKLTSIQALSGGERSLTAIGLLCSLLACFPSPFVFLDEVDAALDDANTIRFGQILGTLAHQTQFVTITHNRETMSHSNLLYGVTMGDDGISKLLSVKIDQAKAYAK